jgi:hypothetical protein
VPIRARAGYGDDWKSFRNAAERGFKKRRADSRDRETWGRRRKRGDQDDRDMRLSVGKIKALARTLLHTGKNVRCSSEIATWQAHDSNMSILVATAPAPP